MNRYSHNPYNRVSCGSCLYWQLLGSPDYGMQEEGLCRRHAPIAMPAQETGNDYLTSRSWPVTYAESDWCGEGVSRFDEDDIVKGMGRK